MVCSTGTVKATEKIAVGGELNEDLEKAQLNGLSL